MTDIVPFPATSGKPSKGPSQVAFDRRELGQILNVYGQMVSKGDWKDYAMDFMRDRAVFSIYRKPDRESPGLAQQAGTVFGYCARRPRAEARA